MTAPLQQERNRFALAVGAASDPGVVRARNEDAYCVILESDDLLPDPLRAVVAVADGMGGHDAGDVASALVVSRVRAAFTSLPAGDPEIVRDALAALAERASAELYAEAYEREATRGMGSTLTVLVLVGDRILTSHVGDTRLYRWRDGLLAQLTEDHTWAAEQDRMGVSADGRPLGGRNLLTRCLGIEPRVTPDLAEHDARSGDRLMLCSDGLHGPVDDHAIATTLSGIADPQQAAAKLVELAIAAGAPDNVTAVVADIVLDPGADAPGTGFASPEVETPASVESMLGRDDDQVPTWPPTPLAQELAAARSAGSLPEEVPGPEDAPPSPQRRNRMRELAGDAASGEAAREERRVDRGRDRGFARWIVLGVVLAALILLLRSCR
jgi:protein phosphatase